MDKPLSPAETSKADSRFLHGAIADELTTDSLEFSKAATAILKFHGVYQQDDRDVRKTGVKQFGAMVRVGVPG